MRCEFGLCRSAINHGGRASHFLMRVTSSGHAEQIDSPISVEDEVAALEEAAAAGADEEEDPFGYGGCLEGCD